MIMIMRVTLSAEVREARSLTETPDCAEDEAITVNFGHP